MPYDWIITSNAFQHCYLNLISQMLQTWRLIETGAELVFAVSMHSLRKVRKNKSCVRLSCRMFHFGNN